jgi:serine/threonine-protein kinase
MGGTAEHVGPWLVDRRLATGATSEVSIATADGGVRTVVLKQLLPRCARDERARTAFAREAAAHSRLVHPAIARLHDTFEDDGRLVLVLEHVEGASLDRVVTILDEVGQGVDDKSAIHVAAELFWALAAAHAAGVVHRDVQPSNLVLGWQGDVKLVDFGLAEVVEAGALDARAPDVRAAGIVLWELLARRRYDRRAASLESLRPDLDRRVLEVVRRALEGTVTAESASGALRAVVARDEGRKRIDNLMGWVRRTAEGPRATRPLLGEAIAAIVDASIEHAFADEEVPTAELARPSQVLASASVGTSARRVGGGRYASYSNVAKDPPLIARTTPSGGIPKPASGARVAAVKHPSGARPAIKPISGARPVVKPPSSAKTPAVPPPLPTSTAKMAAIAAPAPKKLPSAFPSTPRTLVMEVVTAPPPPLPPSPPEAPPVAGGASVDPFPPSGAPIATDPAAVETPEIEPVERAPRRRSRAWAVVPLALGLAGAAVAAHRLGWIDAHAPRVSGWARTAFAPPRAEPPPAAIARTEAPAPPPATDAPSALAPSAPVTASAVVRAPIPAGMGLVKTTGTAPGRRIFVDDQTLGQTPESVLAKCGARTVRVGSAGRPQSITVPCGGEIHVGDR